jgi:hypothetical protein
MLDKVRKLFAKAESVAGTPEADIFNAKAYDLIAKYGVDETAARERAGEGPAPIVTVDITLTGPYITQQRGLLQSIAKSLHCAPLWMSRKTGPDRDIIVGTSNHTDRVQVLFSMLMPQMLAGAAKVRPHAGSTVGVKPYRRSWMLGFLNEVDTRLGAAEKSAADEQPGTGLVLLSDAKRADQQLRAELTPGSRIVSRATRHGYDGHAANKGREAGANVNLGGTGIGGARALNA